VAEGFRRLNFVEAQLAELPLIGLLLGTGVKIALAPAHFSWRRGGQARAMVHLGAKTSGRSGHAKEGVETYAPAPSFSTKSLWLCVASAP
jgi:hypothetical protein